MEIEDVIFHVGILIGLEFFRYASDDTVPLMAYSMWSFNREFIRNDLSGEIFFRYIRSDKRSCTTGINET